MSDGRDRARLLLKECGETLNQRNDEYGDIHDDFSRIAQMWDALFPEGLIVKPHHVAMFMVCLKLSRLTWAEGNRDSWLDIAGYAACGWACAVHEAQGPK